MDTKYHISDYCCIRNMLVSRNGEQLFHGSEKQPAQFLTEIYKHFSISYPKFYKMDNLCKLGFLASEILLNDKNVLQRYASEDVGIILFNAASSMDTDRIHQKSISDREVYFPSPSVFVYTLANIVIGEICIRQKLFGESTFFISEKFDIPVLHSYVSQLFENGIVQCCLTGWLELDGDQYDGMLYLIEKSTSETDGIANFEPDILNDFYTRGI